MTRVLVVDLDDANPDVEDLVRDVQRDGLAFISVDIVSGRQLVLGARVMTAELEEPVDAGGAPASPCVLCLLLGRARHPIAVLFGVQVCAEHMGEAHAVHDAIVAARTVTPDAPTPGAAFPGAGFHWPRPQ